MEDFKIDTDYAAAQPTDYVTFPQSDAGATKQSCPAHVQHDIPCDIKDMVLKEIAGKRVKSYVFEEDKWVEEPPEDAKVRQISLSGRTGIPAQGVLQVLAGRRGAKSATKISVEVIGGPGYHDSSLHPFVTLNGPNEGVKYFVGAGAATSFQFDVWAGTDPSGGAVDWILARYWGGGPPRTFSVDILTCGVWPGGMPVSGGMLLVEAFPADQYTFNLAVPALKKLTHSHEEATKINGTQTISDSSSDKKWRGPETTKSKNVEIGDKEISVATSGSYTKKDPNTNSDYTQSNTHTTTYGEEGVKENSTHTHQYGTTTFIYNKGENFKKQEEVAWRPNKNEIGIQLKRNGQSEDNVVAPIRKIADTLMMVEKSLRDLKASIKEWVPELGWSFEWDIAVMAGSIDLTWGWKEFSDWRVYHRWALNVKVQVFEGSLALKFGIKIGPALAQISGSLEAKAAIDFTGEISGPDDAHTPTQESAKVSALAEAKIQAQAVADVLSVHFERTVGVKSGVQIDASIKFETVGGMGFDVHLKWTGIEAFFISSDPSNGESQKVYRLMKEHKIWDGPFPKK